MPLRGAVRWVLAGALATTLAVAACSGEPDTPRALDDWHPIALPDGMLPSSLTSGDNSLLIGGYQPSGADRRPALARLRIDGTDAGAVPVPVQPATPYGKVAELMSVTTSGGEVIALGAAHGGAHANFRWTAWTGTTDRLVDRPQTFETFGGWEAGTLLGVAGDSRGPLIVGTWQGTHGLDLAVWRPDGERWLRQPGAPALANTSERQVAPRAVDQQPDGSVVTSGSLIDLRDGVRQSAATWHDVDGSWRLTMLPDPGNRSDAWSTACADRCWSVGARDGALAVWTDEARSEVPQLEAEDTDSARIMLWQDRVVAVASTAGDGRLLVGHGGRWRVYTAPDGVVRAAALHGTRLYLVTGNGDSARLVTRELTDVLD